MTEGDVDDDAAEGEEKLGGKPPAGTAVGVGGISPLVVTGEPPKVTKAGGEKVCEADEAEADAEEAKGECAARVGCCCCGSSWGKMGRSRMPSHETSAPPKSKELADACWAVDEPPELSGEDEPA